MSSPTESVASVIERAEARARDGGLEYRGALTPSEAFALVEAGAAHLVDVRSTLEWEYVGHPPQATLIEWKRIPGGELNTGFIKQLSHLGTREENYLFMCRSGARSHAAAVAAAQHGYPSAFNVLEGFEGDLDEHKQRGNRGGWRHAGLPWEQG